LIGHFTLFETTSRAVIREIASLVETNDVDHLIIAEESTSDLLWQNLSRTRKALYKCHPYALLKMGRSHSISPNSLNLRPATSADLDNVIAAHAQAFIAERGVNPLNCESAAFRQRCQDRIERCQTWIYEQDGELLFKVELMGQTTHFSYLEGVWTNPAYRGLGLGKRCLAAMADRLLVDSKVVCLLADENEAKRTAFYDTSGFEKCGRFIAHHYAPKLESD
jgi:predicted GNAT family acetyltransferase